MSDEELADILVNESDYVAEAISQVKDELRRRRIPKEDYKKLIGKRTVVQKKVKRKAVEELKPYQKALCFCFPFYFPIASAVPLLGFLLPRPPGMLTFHEEGYFRKSSQVLKYTVGGFVFWITALIVYFMLTSG